MKVFILDDQPERCERLKTLLRQIDRRAHFMQADNWKPVLRTLKFGLPDLLVIDWQQNWISAADIIELLRTYPTLQIAIFTEDLASMDIRQLLQAGVLGVLPRSLDPRHVLRVLGLILDGGHYIPCAALNLNLPNPSCSTIGASHVNMLPKHLLQNNSAKGISRLSPRQHQIIRFLHMGNTNKMMAKLLNISEGTVKVHLGTIYRLLGATNRASAVAFYNNWQFEHQTMSQVDSPLQNSVEGNSLTLIEGTSSEPQSIAPFKFCAKLLNKATENDSQQQMIAQPPPPYSSNASVSPISKKMTKGKNDH